MYLHKADSVSAVREEVRPIKSEIRIYDFAKYDFVKYINFQCKTH
jgi:P2-related tail formation protein